MKIPTLRHWLFGALMLIAAALAMAMKPSQMLAEKEPKIDLETMIPKQFGDWKLDSSIVPIVPNPQQEAMINKIYNQTLSRTYINRAGQYVMLEIAYGGDQSKTMQVHRPEVCYSAQGFQIGRMYKDYIDVGSAQLPVMRLVATQGTRVEPITYWVMIGDSAVRGNLEQGFARLKYGLTGKIPYGILVRVSTISGNESESYRVEEQFVHDMLGSISLAYRKVLSGEG